MTNKIDYSLYKCPYDHLEKVFGHELHGPETDTDPEDLKLEIK